MQLNLVRCSRMSLVALAAMSCTDPVAPPSAPTGQLEPLTAVITSRYRSSGEKLPNVTVFGGRGTVTVQVSTLGPCAPIVNAGVARSAGSLDVVATIWPNPIVDCVTDDQSVESYVVVIPRMAAGFYTVRVFQRMGDAAPSFVGQARAAVSPPIP
jgi:hypothetical protein